MWTQKPFSPQFPVGWWWGMGGEGQLATPTGFQPLYAYCHSMGSHHRKVEVLWQRYKIVNDSEIGKIRMAVNYVNLCYLF